jgi:hypothetical protein
VEPTISKMKVLLENKIPENIMELQETNTLIIEIKNSIEKSKQELKKFLRKWNKKKIKGTKSEKLRRSETRKTF